jgi:hypothetical protein
MGRNSRSAVVLGSTLFTLGAIGCGGRLPGPDTARGASAAQAAALSPASLAAAAPQPTACRQPLPAATLAVPAGHELELELAAEGVQIYTCTATPAGAAWVFTAPEATLSSHGQVAGRHYAGPTWEALDGSTVVGARVAGATPDPTAIPWLLLRAVSHGGAGTLAEVSFIQRVATRGGLAPVGGCDAATVGAVARTPYGATYCFFEPEPER